MANFYMPVYNKKLNCNDIYNMEYDKDYLNKFLDNIRFTYQDKHIHNNSGNDLVEYSVNPLLYTILMDMMHYNVLNLCIYGC